MHRRAELGYGLHHNMQPRGPHVPCAMPPWAVPQGVCFIFGGPACFILVDGPAKRACLSRP